MKNLNNAVDPSEAKDRESAEQSRLQALQSLEILDTPRERVFDHITDQVARHFDAPIVLISLVDENRQWFKSCHGIDVREMDINLSFCKHALNRDEFLLIPDTHEDDFFQDHPLVTGEPYIRFYLGFKLVLEDGHSIGTLCVIDRKPRNDIKSKDISFLKAMAEMTIDCIQMRSDQMKLEETRAFRELVFDTIPDAVFVKDEQSRIIRANKAFLETYPEDKRDRIIGSTTFEMYDTEQAEQLKEHDRRTLQNGASELEMEMSLPNGQARTMLSKKVRFRNARGDNFILVMGRDITELRQKNNDLLKANKELEEFAYRTSHDLRSPLVSSINLLNMTKRFIEQGQTQKALESVGLVSTSLTKLDTLIKDILNLTKTKNEDEERECLNLTELVNDTLWSLCNLEDFDRLQVDTDLQAPPDIIVQKSRLILIIENMISNAIKYQNPDETEPYVTIRSYLEKNRYIIEVEDNGLGIPEDQQSKLFKMFKRFHPKISYGSGLGLYMMKCSADILGGKMEFENPGKGSLFRLIMKRNIVAPE